MVIRLRFLFGLSLLPLATAIQAQPHFYWGTRLDGPAFSADTFTAATVDSAGSIVAVGSMVDAVTGMNYVVAKYKPDGTILWFKQLSTSSLPPDPTGLTQNGWEVPTAVGVDSARNIWVTGYSSMGSGAMAWQTYKLAPTGARLISYRLDNTTGARYNAGMALRVLADDSVVMAGTRTSGNLQSACLTRLSSSGSPAWEINQHSILTNRSLAADMELSGDDRIVVTGGHRVGINPANGFAWVANLDGSVVYNRIRSTTGSDAGTQAAFASDGNVVYLSQPDGADTEVVKLDAAGAVVGKGAYNPLGATYVDTASALLATSSGQIFAAGNSDPATGTPGIPNVGIQKFTLNAVPGVFGMYPAAAPTLRPGLFSDGVGVRLLTTTVGPNIKLRASLLRFRSALTLLQEEHFTHYGKSDSSVQNTWLGSNGDIIGVGYAVNGSTVTSADALLMRWSSANKPVVQVTNTKNTTIVWPLKLQSWLTPTGSTSSLVEKGTGNVSVSANGTFTYTPVTDFLGVDTFAYTNRKGALDSGVREAVVEVERADIRIKEAVATRLGDGWVQVDGSLRLLGDARAINVKIVGANLATASSGTTFPIRLGDIMPGSAPKTFSLLFPSVPVGSQRLRLNLTWVGDSGVVQKYITIP